MYMYMKMKSVSGLGLGLSLVFGCLLLALIAELYYLLWWKKRIITKIDENGSQIQSKTSNFLYIFCCWKNPTSPSRSTAQELCSSPTLVHQPQSSSNSNRDLWLKQENMENFPRFLFTITEETREDLESEDGIIKNKNRSNLNDLLQIMETPFLTPIASPPYFTPPLTPSFSEYHPPKFDPFLDSAREIEFNRLRTSPPPKFKFLRDAEEKLVQRRRVIEENGNGGDDANKDEGNGQYIALNIITENQEDDEEEGFFRNDSSSSSSSKPVPATCGVDHTERNSLGKKECSSSSSSKVVHLVSPSSSALRETLQQQIQIPHDVKFNVC